MMLLMFIDRINTLYEKLYDLVVFLLTRTFNFPCQAGLEIGTSIFLCLVMLMMIFFDKLEKNKLKDKLCS